MKLILCILLLISSTSCTIASSTQNDHNSFFSEVGGLILTFEQWPSNAAYLESKLYEENGAYVYKDLIDDSITLTLKRTDPLKTHDVDKIASYIADEYKSNETPEIIYDEDLSTKLTYIAYRLIYSTGENEDSCAHHMIYACTDKWDYIVDISIPLDIYDDYITKMEDWIGTLTFQDLNDGT